VSGQSWIRWVWIETGLGLAEWSSANLELLRSASLLRRSYGKFDLESPDGYSRPGFTCCQDALGVGTGRLEPNGRGRDHFFCRRPLLLLDIQVRVPIPRRLPVVFEKV